MGSWGRCLFGLGLLLLAVSPPSQAAGDLPLHRLTDSEIKAVLHDVGIEPVDGRLADHYEVFGADGVLTVQGRARLIFKYEVHDAALWIIYPEMYGSPEHRECRAIVRDATGDLYFTSCDEPLRKGMRFRTVPARR